MASSTPPPAFWRHHLGSRNKGAPTPGVGSQGWHLDSRQPRGTPTAGRALPGDAGRPPANRQKGRSAWAPTHPPTGTWASGGAPRTRAWHRCSGRDCRSAPLLTPTPHLSMRGGQMPTALASRKGPRGAANTALTGRPQTPRADLISSRGPHTGPELPTGLVSTGWERRRAAGESSHPEPSRCLSGRQAGRTGRRGPSPNAPSTKTRPEWVGSRPSAEVAGPNGLVPFALQEPPDLGARTSCQGRRSQQTAWCRHTSPHSAVPPRANPGQVWAWHAGGGVTQRPQVGTTSGQEAEGGGGLTAGNPGKQGRFWRDFPSRDTWWPQVSPTFTCSSSSSPPEGSGGGARGAEPIPQARKESTRASSVSDFNCLQQCPT